MDDKNLVDILTIDSLKRCFNSWGIEATEDKINTLCKDYPKMKEVMLRNYKGLVNDKR